MKVTVEVRGIEEVRLSASLQSSGQECHGRVAGRSTPARGCNSPRWRRAAVDTGDALRIVMLPRRCGAGRRRCPTTARSPLPHALEIDEAIEAHLAAFDTVDPEVRRAAWTVAATVQRLSPAAALQVVAFVARVAARELSATRLQ